MTVKLVIFDCDGVLVDTEHLTDEIISESLSKYGFPMTPDEFHKLFVGGTLYGVAKAATEQGAVLPDDWADEVYAAIYARLANGADVFPGVFDLLDRIDAAGMATAIASNGPQEKMRLSLGPSGLFDRFGDRIYSGHDFGAKPAPDMLLHACTVAGVDPSQAVMIDDSVPGCSSAQNANMRCFGYASGGNPDALAAVGATPVTHMDDIARALGLL